MQRWAVVSWCGLCREGAGVLLWAVWRGQVWWFGLCGEMAGCLQVLLEEGASYGDRLVAAMFGTSVYIS